MDSEPHLATSRIVCPNCGGENESRDAFCTTCGWALPAAQVAASAETAAELAGEPRKGRGSRLLRSRLGLFGVVAAVAAATLGTLWVIELGRAHHLSNELASTQAALHESQGRLARTLHKLSAATALSRRRRSVLLQAQTVLTKVTPLLSSVDGLQSRAQSLQSDAGSLSSDSYSLNQTMITLVNYLLANNSVYWDIAYIQSLINQANSELNSVSSDVGAVASADGSYNRASKAFGNKADSFSSSVLSLQKQLKEVTAP